ncbi:uncharacterized protein ARMOST_08562 [Armillaria ostoyae]|uniref:Uncharacterized protein n=1 Tax=Armillaria ostoyae TaxID=47428 RepID=A0A284R909_ARMOS|nr:uncharacterized protein ARMOST_08562 [Armillaria ostoyae]
MVKFLNVQREEPGVEAEEVKETAGEDVDAIPSQEMTVSDAMEREIVAASLIHHKNETKDRLKWCSPNEYDTLDDLLTQTNMANKAVIKLQKHLSPHSVFRKCCDRKELQKKVEEANSLISSLPFKTSMDMSDDQHLAIRGIVTERPSAGTRKKPMFNNGGLYY